MSSQSLRGEMVSTAVRAKRAGAAAAQRTTSAAIIGDAINDGVVATSSVLLIGSFFWVGAVLTHHRNRFRSDGTKPLAVSFL